MSRIGGPDDPVSPTQLHRFVTEAIGSLDVAGRSVCVVVPDGTRTCPLPLLLDAVLGALAGRADAVRVLIALGTHAPMGLPAIARHVAAASPEITDDAAAAAAITARFPGVTFENHAWHDPTTFATLGTIPGVRLAELSGGRLDREVIVRVNRAVVDDDLTLIVGPVFPHEVVGFSGGHKYLFPGLSGPEMIDVSHWLGALITSAQIIGTLGVTPVRALIDEAAALVPKPVRALCVVPVAKDASGTVHAASFGDPRSAWHDAAAVAARTHVRRVAAPVSTVVSIVPRRYNDLWTAAKGFYKVEPIVADGGRVILYAPHVTEIAPMHPGIEAIGYHCRDYFTAQWERFAEHPWGELAHSTHLRGAGTYDPDLGERSRVTVTLATGIPEARTRAVGLDWMDPATLDLAAWRSRSDALVVPDAGEVLYRLHD